MKKFKILLTMLFACLFIGGVSACNQGNLESVSSSDTSMEETTDIQMENSSQGGYSSAIASVIDSIPSTEDSEDQGAASLEESSSSMQDSEILGSFDSSMDDVESSEDMESIEDEDSSIEQSSESSESVEDIESSTESILDSENSEKDSSSETSIETSVETSVESSVSSEDGDFSESMLESASSEDEHPHVWDEGVITQAATCSQLGKKTFTCECGIKMIVNIPKIAHSYDQGVVTTAPTCTEQGVKTFTCMVCSNTWTKLLPIEHTYENEFCILCGAEKAFSQGLQYDFDEWEEVYIVSGIGTCTDTELIIPSTHNDLPVIGISGNAFQDCTGLTSVVIPDSVTSIERGAFKGCTSLLTVELGVSLNKIDDNAFDGCYRLVEIYNKSSLIITFGSRGNGCLGYYAKNIYTPTEGESKLFKTEDGYIFYTDGASVVLIQYIGTATDVVLPDNVTTIYQKAFYQNTALTSVVIGDAVTEIENNAFNGCTSLIDVQLGMSVATLGGDVFNNCSALTMIELPNAMTNIGDSFGGCESLVGIVLPASITSIEDAVFMETPLKTVYYKGSFIQWGQIAIGAYNLALDNAEIYYYSESQPTSFGDWWYYVDEVPTLWETVGNYSRGLSYTLNADGVSLSLTGKGTCQDKMVKIPPSYNNLPITEIGDNAWKLSLFEGLNSITSVELGDSVAKIGSNAFASCISLTSVVMNNSVTSIEEKAFFTMMQSVYYKGTASDWESIAIGENNDALLNATVYYYSETEPTEDGNWWHYVDGEPTAWVS